MVGPGKASSLISRVSCASINYYIHLPLARRVVRGDSAPGIQPKMKVSWERDNNYYKTLGDKVRVIKRRLKAWAPRLMKMTLGRQCSDLVRAWVDGNEFNRSEMFLLLFCQPVLSLYSSNSIFSSFPSIQIQCLFIILWTLIGWDQLLLCLIINMVGIPTAQHSIGQTAR